MNLTEDGKKALMTLSLGDMRRVLNILQSCAMAFDTVSEVEKLVFIVDYFKLVSVFSTLCTNVLGILRRQTSETSSTGR